MKAETRIRSRKYDKRCSRCDLGLADNWITFRLPPWISEETLCEECSDGLFHAIHEYLYEKREK